MVAKYLADKPSCVFHLLFDAQEYLFAKDLADMNSSLDKKLKQVKSRLICYEQCFVAIRISNLPGIPMVQTLEKKHTVHSF